MSSDTVPICVLMCVVMLLLCCWTVVFMLLFCYCGAVVSLCVDVRCRMIPCAVACCCVFFL